MKCIKCKKKIPDGSMYCNYCGKKQIAVTGQKTEFKVPAARQLPSGSWMIQLRLNGQSTTVTKPTEAECIAEARRIKAEHIADKKARADKASLGAVLDEYIKKRSNVLSPATIRGYGIIREHRFKSVIDKDVNDIDWQEVLNGEAAKYSARTLKNSWGLVSAALKDHGIIPPKVRLPQIVEKDHPYLEPEQIKIFVEALKGEKVEIPALLALHSLRLSELIALTWDNVDLKSKTISVAGAKVMDQNNKYVYKTTNKNKSSRRTVPIMIDELYYRLLAVKDKSGFVVKMDPTVIYKRINNICEHNDLPLVGIHGLRHSFASLAYHLGIPERIAMDTGGWSDRETMHKIYIHLSRQDIKKYQDQMHDFYKSANDIAI